MDAFTDCDDAERIEALRHQLDETPLGVILRFCAERPWLLTPFFATGHLLHHALRPFQWLPEDYPL